MKKQKAQNVDDELKQYHCSILLQEVKEKVQKLKSYGVDEDEIMSVMSDEVAFPILIVTEDYKIVLSGERRVVVQMEPLIKAVYLLFLSHPEGIVLKCLPDYRNELRRIYQLLRPVGITSRAEKSIMDVTDPMLNSIHEKCARIRRYFSSLLPRNVASSYFISGKRGEVKKINLDPAYLIWKCHLPFSQGL